MVLRFFKFYFRNILILLPSARASPSNGHIVRFLQNVTDIITSAFYWKEYRRARPLQNDECQILLQKHSNSTAICSCVSFKRLHRAFPSNGHRQSRFCFLLEGISSCASPSKWWVNKISGGFQDDINFFIINYYFFNC